MKAFAGSEYIKRRAIQDAKLARMGGHLYAWGHYWHHDGGKCRGNVTGALLHPYMEPGETEHDLSQYWEMKLGIPWQVGHMLDDFFGGLCLHDNKDLHQQWPEQVMEAIAPGTDLSGVRDKMVAYILEHPDWLAAFSDEECAHLIGYMQGIFTMRIEGINQDKRIKDFYYNHIHKKHRHRFHTSTKDCKKENYGWAALRCLSGGQFDENSGPMHYFLHHAAHGSARHTKQSRGKRWVELSQIFLQMIEDAA